MLKAYPVAMGQPQEEELFETSRTGQVCPICKFGKVTPETSTRDPNHLWEKGDKAGEVIQLHVQQQEQGIAMPGRPVPWVHHHTWSNHL